MHASIRTRLLVSLLVIALTTAGALSWYFIRELEGYGLRKLEERLASEAQLVAAVAGTAGMDDPRALGDALHDAALEVNSRLIVLDTEGIAIADSANVPQLGTDYSSRPEIGQALAGEYGAYTRLSPAGRLALYVAYPVTRAGEVTGVAYSSAQTFSILTLLQDYRARLGSFVVLFAAVTLVLAELLARWLSRPLRRLEAGAVAFANGDHDARVTPSGSRETRAVGAAFNTMADEVERVVSELRDEERRKSQFVSDVSHELRSPLTAIRGTAETLLEGDVPAEDEQRFLSTIVRESERLARLADDLLALQRIEGATGELAVRRVDLRAVAQEASDALEHLTTQRHVRVEITGEAPAVLGEPDRLQQVVANLLDNASRHMPDGGTVTIELGRDNTHALLAVADEGPGIDEQALPHVFDRFYRAQTSRDRISGGAGLGLSIVKAIVGRHAGEITAENRTEGGSRFTVRLPALRD
ncbi:MAG: ATP-binding protein [Coriobacteriia bacterium]|nr:ATP-binding protein [Coriobacteriia bacterium]